MAILCHNCFPDCGPSIINLGLKKSHADFHSAPVPLCERLSCIPTLSEHTAWCSLDGRRCSFSQACPIHCVRLSAQRITSRSGVCSAAATCLRCPATSCRLMKTRCAALHSRNCTGQAGIQLCITHPPHIHTPRCLPTRSHPFQLMVGCMLSDRS